MELLLALSENWSQIGDWIAEHFAQVGAMISIPAVVTFIVKFILTLVKNKATIKNAVIGATNTLNTGVGEIKLIIEDFKKEMEEKLPLLVKEEFAKIQEQRKELYEEIMGEKLPQVEQVVEDTKNQVLEQVNEVYEELVEELENNEICPNSVEIEPIVEQDTDLL